jgi:tagatose-6-phosphate ketose/aldose isomerase
VNGKNEMELLAAQGKITAKEILQQPALWQETVRIIESKMTEIRDFLVKPLARKNLRIIIAGAGTSAYAGDIAAPHLRKALGFRVDSIATTDLVASPQNYFEKATPTILVSCARSGDSPESVAAYELAQQCVDEVYQVVVTCNPRGDLAQKTGGKAEQLLLLMPPASNDKGFAMTGSFSCMVLTLLMMFDLPNFSQRRELVREVAACGGAILEKKAALLKELAVMSHKRIVYLGSAALKGLAQEAALKTLELSSGRVVSLFESVLGFRHGPKSIVNDETLVFVFLSNDDYARQYDMDLLKELRREKGGYHVVAVTYGPDKRLTGIADSIFVVNPQALGRCEDAYASLAYVLYAQMYAIFNSLALGIAPDNPRPDGTVNRVVQGVVIHKWRLASDGVLTPPEA